MIPALINTLSGAQAVSAYSADIALTGEQYNFAGQLNFGYKISKNWSVAAGVRLNYISNYYVGSLKNIQLQPTGIRRSCQCHFTADRRQGPCRECGTDCVCSRE